MPEGCSVSHLSPWAGHNELQHGRVVSPGVDLCQVVQMGAQRAQTPLDHTPFVDQVLKHLRESEETTEILFYALE